MAASFPESARAGLAVALLCGLTAAALAAAPAPVLPRPTKEPIELVASSSDFDYKNNRLRFVQVRITQGPIQVEAREATASGLNFDNSEWTLTGDVRITVPDGKLTSSSATVTFRDKEIAKAVIRGTPAEFEQKLKGSQQLAKGHATSIEYDVTGGTVRLTGAAWLTDGANAIQGETLVYDVGRQRVQANPGGTIPGGVHITINPQSQDKAPTKGKESPPQSKPDAPQ